MKNINKAGVSGFVFCFLVIMFGIASNGGAEAIIKLLHFPSFLVTVGGTFFAVLATSDSFEDFVFGLKGFGVAYQKSKYSQDDVSEAIMNYSDTARREGLLALEELSHQTDNDFLRKGIDLIVDGTDPELVKDIMETELFHIEDRDRNRVKFWEDLGAYAPAWGMVGTLLGLINMMGSMTNDTSMIGSGMSLALITTWYGSILANWICIPIARKLEKKSREDEKIMEIIIEGVLSIQAGENNRIIKEKLKAILLEEDVAA